MAASYVEENARELARLRELVAGLSDSDLAHPATDEWSVADMLGHVAFWDARASMLAEKLGRGTPFSEGDHEPEDVESMNAAVAVLIRQLPARQVAALAVQLAESTDALLAALPAEKMWPEDQSSPLNAFRAHHRGEHLDQIEAALNR